MAARKPRTLLVAQITFTLCLSGAALAQEPLTGTRLNTAGTGNPRTVIRMQRPDEVLEIERLLLAGDIEKALARAKRLAEQVDKSGMDTQSRYFAHNALCLVLTKLRDEQAMAECDTAVNLVPGHWSARNNRGTLHYLNGDFTAAKQDYQRALELAKNHEQTEDMLRHNLRLVELKLKPVDRSE